jgi:hypothetical protein
MEAGSQRETINSMKNDEILKERSMTYNKLLFFFFSRSFLGLCVAM